MLDSNIYGNLIKLANGLLIWKPQNLRLTLSGLGGRINPPHIKNVITFEMTFPKI